MAGIKDRQRRLREDIREKIKAGYHYGEILKFTNKSPQEFDAHSFQVEKAQVDVHLKVLDKVLPSLKAVDFQGDLTVSTQDDYVQSMREDDEFDDDDS